MADTHDEDWGYFVLSEVEKRRFCKPTAENIKRLSKLLADLIEEMDND